MSSETDHPRQRTVAELLAAHGDSGATGRRRRRRESDEPDEGGEQVAVPYGAAPVAEPRPSGVPDRSVLREPVPQPSYEPRASSAPVREPVPRPAPPREPVVEAPRSAVPPRPAGPPAVAPPAPPVPVAPPAAAAPVPAARPRPDVRREQPTDVMPRFRDQPPAVDDGLTGPIPQQPTGAAADADDDGPSTMIGGAPVGAEAWHLDRTADARRAGPAVDDGPPLPAGPVDAGEEPAGLGGGPTAAVSLEKDDDPAPRERRLGRAAATGIDTASPSWPAVLGQWVAGALGGAVLWVLFRFLWSHLQVVAVAAAVLVTIGLVVAVRALLHNDDRRTTVFAVLVGLLLTVSPAILVFLGP